MIYFFCCSVYIYKYTISKCFPVIRVPTHQRPIYNEYLASGAVPWWAEIHTLSSRQLLTCVSAFLGHSWKTHSNAITHYSQCAKNSSRNDKTLQLAAKAANRVHIRYSFFSRSLVTPIQQYIWNVRSCVDYQKETVYYKKERLIFIVGYYHYSNEMNVENNTRKRFFLFHVSGVTCSFVFRGMKHTPATKQFILARNGMEYSKCCVD